MKYFNYISILLFVSFTALASCTQDDNMGNEEGAKQNFQISVSDTGFESDNATRATENNYSTIFANGDAIGIFAVRNGAIVSNINNVRCSMQDGAWEMETNIEYKESEFKKMSFYAYYPYSETFNSDTDFDASKTLTDGDPFEGYVANWKVDAEQNETNYTKYDLMTSVGKASGQRLKGEVSFVMQHRMALAVIQMPDLVYDFTNTDVAIDDYILPTQAGSFKLNNKIAKPYEQQINDRTFYRFLVNPNKEFTIAGTYIAGKEEKGYDHKATLTSGQAKLYKVKNPESIKQVLSIGDYFCADGSIISKATGVVPSNAIGIILYTGNPQPSANNTANGTNYTDANDALKRDFSNCTHGLVMALNNTQNDVGIMEGTSSYSDWLNANADLKNSYVLCNTGKVDDPAAKFPGYLGYNNTKILFEAHATLNTYCNNAYLQVTTYSETVPNPPTASTWYIPSGTELKTMAANMITLNTSITAAGGVELVSTAANATTGFYWSSTERNGNTQWVHGLEGGAFAQRRDLSNSSGRFGYFRLILAF